MKVRILIATYLNDKHVNRINSLYCIVYSLLYQTYSNFEIVIHHDGPLEDISLPDRFEKIDNRIKFITMPERKGNWGFHDRWNIAIDTQDADWILFTNDDNYYVPSFLEFMLKTANEEHSDIVFCNMLHNCGDLWKPMDTMPVCGSIDLGSYMSKTELVKKTTWDDFSWIADYKYLEKLIQNGGICKKINKTLFVHN
jgi:Glycosyl transferase family 2